MATTKKTPDHWINGQPDYFKIYNDRVKRLNSLKSDPKMQVGAFEYYRDKPCEFIVDWCMTYDPRKQKPEPKRMPFIMFKRQYELVYCILDCLNNNENLLIEKCRDAGVTWICVCFSVWLWIYGEGASIGWGSRKEMLVDRLGDPDSIFEKIRMVIDALPKFFIPNGFNRDKHATFMKLLNPQTGATISGEAGDNIGRGGRKTIYFKDESAHYERPEKIESSLGDNTEVQVDISSVNGTGNVFHRRRMAGEIWGAEKEIKSGTTRVFIFDWRDHPLKTQEWYDRRKDKFESEGLGHVFAQEVDRDYSSAVVGVVIPSKWVKAAIDAHIKLKFEAEGIKFSALDVADEEGIDTNAQSVRHGVVLRHAEEWGGIDTTKTARRAVDICEEHGVKEFYYDCIGVGAGVRGEVNSIADKRDIKNLPFNVHPWNAALSGKSLPNAEKRVIQNDKESPLVKDFYASLKSMGWWELRLRFEKTYKAVTYGDKYDPDELISIDSRIDNLHQIEDELSRATWTKSDSTGKIIINKQPNGTQSPNLADCIMMAYRPPSIKSRVIIPRGY